MKVDKRLVNSFRSNGLGIPSHTAAAISRYLFLGLHPGSFLTSVFAGQLHTAIFQADVENRRYFVDIVKWVEWSAPKECKGSVEQMDKWMRLDDFARREILIENRLAYSVFEVLKGRETTEEVIIG